MAYQSLTEQQIGTILHPYDDWVALKVRYTNNLWDITQMVNNANKTDFDFLTLICTDIKYWNSDENYKTANKMLEAYGV